ncbi:hypothetical protein BGP_0456 [Beggiatoa sp. PS]|nr:hypothetical protein BGP_0456 [Beggiatoa sp. PS]
MTSCLVFASFSSWAGNSGVLSLGNEHSCGIKNRQHGRLLGAQ